MVGDVFPPLEPWQRQSPGLAIGPVFLPAIEPEPSEDPLLTILNALNAEEDFES